MRSALALPLFRWLRGASAPGATVCRSRSDSLFPYNSPREVSNDSPPSDDPPPLGSRVGHVDTGASSEAASETDDESPVGDSGGSALGLSFQFAGSLLLFTLGGHFLDGRLDSSPLFLLLGVAAGLVGGFVSMLYHVRRLGSR